MTWRCVQVAVSGLRSSFGRQAWREATVFGLFILGSFSRGALDLDGVSDLL
jgi:hypothetical protein